MKYKIKILSSCVLACLLCLFYNTIHAQDFIQIKNRWQKDGKTDYRIHIQNAAVEAGSTQPGWWSAQWVLENVNGTHYYRIKNRWQKDGKTDYYLHNEKGKIEAGAIQPGWQSAQWELEKVNGANFYRIKNRWKSDQYLNIQGSSLSVSKIENNWWSAQWQLEGFKGAVSRKEDGKAPVTKKSTIKPQTNTKSKSGIGNAEKSPAATDVMSIAAFKLDKNGSRWRSNPLIKDLTVPNLVRDWNSNGQFKAGDHIQGMARTASGRFAFSMSRQGPGSNCGLLIYPEGRGLTSKCVLSKHPSSMQAVGEIVAVASGGGPKFFALPNPEWGGFKPLSHLSFPGGGEAVGVAYHPKEDRFYAFSTRGGGVTLSDNDALQNVKLYRTPKGKSLLDPATRFTYWKTFKGIPISGQGANLLIQKDGKMFITSAFSTDAGDDDIPGVTADCTLQGISAFRKKTRYPFDDIVTLYQLFPDQNIAIPVIPMRDLGLTRALCVQHRPAFRFAGNFSVDVTGFVTIAWANRFNPPVIALKDNNLQIATKILAPGL